MDCGMENDRVRQMTGRVLSALQGSEQDLAAHNKADRLKKKGNSYADLKTLV